MQPLDPAYRPRPRQRPRRRFGCLVWLMAGLAFMALAAVITLGAAYAGWHAGIDIARENARGTAAADINQQCGRASADIAAGNQTLAGTRLDYLTSLEAPPACLDSLIPSATALAFSTPIPPTETATAAPQPITNAPTAMPSPTAIPFSPTEQGISYDLDDLLAQARDEMSQREYQAAVDTLDAISALDPAFQRDAVRRLYFEALSAEATIMLRGGQLAQGILWAGRAEAYGVLPDQLAGERNIAAMYLNAMGLKQVSPGDAIRQFKRIAYDFSSPNYQNVLGELKAAYVAYGDAFAFGGDHCSAMYQYQAALEMQGVGGGTGLRGKLRRAETDCANATPLPTVAGDAGDGSRAPAAIGVRASPAPVGGE